MLRTKGKYASSTENRRLVWENIIWPLVLKKNRHYFSIEEYHTARDEFYEEEGTNQSKVARGFVSLIVKGLLVKDKNLYSVHYRIIPYMRKKIKLEYGQAIREIGTN
ncbi:MAG: hypothetical protein CMO16_02615 [Thaumarchaeota archaeon]|nr:hypothetical protein [Nitrososphaerota archaeon]|tara:strand:- start:1210 stop:1530 length:321 start_codon:yes stop_codon:yes gene_type:complete